MSKQTRILVVEDSPSLGRTYSSYLRQEEYTVFLAETGKQAMEVLSGDCPDAVLLDLNLPDMSGMDILKYIQEQDLQTAIIVITAEASLNVAVEAMRLGADDFVAKPVSSERLLISLSNALEKTRACAGKGLLKK